MYKIALITASIGNPDKPELILTPECEKEFKEYGVDVFRFNDKNVHLLQEHFIPIIPKEQIYQDTFFLKLRYWIRHFLFNMQSEYPKKEDKYKRLVAKIPRMLFFRIIPNDYDYYIWCDSKFTLEKGWLGSILKLIEENSDKDVFSYAHSERNSIQEEFDYMRYHMRKRNPSLSLLARYNISDMDNQIYLYKKNKKFIDDSLYETGIMIYSKKLFTKTDFLDQWYANNYYLTIQDQLSFPFLLALNKINIYKINQSIFDSGFTKYNYY